MNSLEHALQLLTEANGSITSERISPSQSGSSKRKSRPVKRIINENEEFNVTAGELECAGMDVPEPLLASIQQQITSYASEEDGHRDEDEGASSEVLSTGSVEDTMEQTTIANADLLRKVAEVLSAGQQQQQNQQNQQQQQQRQYQQQFQNHSHSQTQGMTVFDHYLLAAKSLANGNGLLAPQISPLIGNTNSVSENYTSPECLLQAMLTPNLNFGLGHNPLVTNPPTNGLLQTPVVSPNSNFFQTFMNTQSVLAASRKPENRPPVVSQTLKATKRRLFTDDERARAEAANLNSDERIDMSDLEAFAQTFKKQRIKFGFTQGDVGVALGKRYGTDFSQTTISRFEALNLSFKNMCKLRPLLKEWLADIETAIEGGATITDLIERRTSSTNFNGSGVHMPELHISTSEASNSPTPVQTLLMNRDQHVKRRRKRTNLDLNQRASLDAYFAMNPRPDHDRMTEIANALELDRDVVRVWFCNRRQKMRRVDEPTEGEVATPSVSPLFASFQHMNALEQLQAVKMVSSQHLNNDDSDGTSGSPDAPSVSLDGSNDV